MISDYQSVNVMTTLSISILNISQQFIMTITLLGTMYIAGRKVLNGKITIGSKPSLCFPPPQPLLFFSSLGFRLQALSLSPISPLSVCLLLLPSLLLCRALDFIAVNTYTLSVFMPLFNLGMIYNMTVQGLIDFRQFMQLLLTVPEILDEENAQDIPLVTNSNSATALATRSTSSSHDQPMRLVHKAGVSVEFKGSL
jgi:ABC-type transport system involved in Fe-S cluster assembly fused permease/ATPase subunit